MIEISPELTFIPVILTVLNEGLKKYFGLESKYCVAINWIGGIFIYLAFRIPHTSAELAEGIVAGFLLGSSASGLYSGAKRAVGK